MNTKDKIINSAIHLFSEIPYADVSLLQISKHASVSNGIIYKYFKNKEDLFRYLLNMISDKVEYKLKDIVGNTIEERLEDYIIKNLEITREEHRIIKIFREGQYRFPEYEHRIKKAYLKSLEKIFQRKLTTAQILYVLGSIRYINISYSSRDLFVDTKFFVKILLNGFSQESPFNMEDIYNMDLYQRKRLCTNNTKYQLLEKGEQLFGKTEYHEVKIKELADVMGISVGSFYTFFPTKESFLNEIVSNLKKEILFLFKDNYDEDLQINQLHTMYLYISLEFYKNASFKYKLLRDMEFLDFDIYIDFLNKAENFYMSTFKNFDYTTEEKRILANILLGIQHCMIIQIFFIKDVKNTSSLLKEIAHLFNNGTKTSKQ